MLIQNQSKPVLKPINAKICNSFLKRLKGLMFQSSLAEFDGLLFINPGENKLDSAIHMLFMNFDIAVLWLDSNKKVVDKKLAKKWAWIVTPAQKAKFILEIHPNRLPEYSIGDRLEF